MKETVLIVGEQADQEYRDCTTLLSRLMPDHHVLPCSLNQCLYTVNSNGLFIVAVVFNVLPSQHQAALQMIRSLMKADPHLPSIVWVHYGEEDFARDAVRSGAYDYHVKPVASEKVVLSLRHAYELRRMRSYISRLEQHVAEQRDISPHERQAILMNQMHHMLVDENGALKSLRELEKEIIEAALRYTNGCVSRAANSLGIGRSTLYRKVGEYAIPNHNRRDNQTTRPNILASSGSNGVNG